MGARAIELSITGITGANRRAKFLKALRALSDHMGLSPDVHAPWMGKARKYISREWKNGRWVYTYPGESAGGNGRAGLPVISSVSRLNVDESNYQKLAEAEFAKLRAKIKEGLFCAALGGRKVVAAKESHLASKRGEARRLKDIIGRVALMPYIIPAIEQGMKTGERKNPQYRGNYYEISATTREGKKVSVILADKNDGYLYISVMEKKVIRKALCQSSHPLPTDAGSLIPGFGKGLPYRAAWGRSGSASLRPPHDISIPHVYEKSMRRYPDLELTVADITDANRKDKFAKALRAVSRHLGVPLSITRKGAGEPHMFPVRRELSDRWAGFYAGLTEKVYAAVAAALGLPSVSVETVGKAQGGGVLRYRGKIVYNPEAGQPLKNKDFDGLIEAIQNFLNRNTKGIAKQMLLDSAAIEKLLKRMARYQTGEEMEKLRLDGLKYRGKTFDWIREDIRNLNAVLGAPMGGPEMARYQAARDYAASLVTRTNRKINDDVRDAVLRGIVERRTKGQISQDLFNRLGSENRDWKRIADTEMANTSNLAGILEEVNGAEPGEKVYFRRYELPGACDTCAKVNGAVALWSDAPLASEKIAGDPHAEIAIWEGKGREMGLVTGALHPNCRGGWTRWGGPRVDAIAARIQGRGEKWDAAVGQARGEWLERGVENPTDQTPGYVDRINEIFRGG